MKILTIDIGGTYIKATILDQKGEILQDYTRISTPSPATPAEVIKEIKKLIAAFPSYDKVSVGFPGYVKKGIIITAPNLNTDLWKHTDLTAILTNALKKPVRVLNDADMHGLGIATGKGLEMIITLGTGMGTALLFDGILLPHLELAHHKITKTKDYDAYIGDRTLKAIGEKKWNSRIKKILVMLQTVFNYDHLYIGGGNAKKLNLKFGKNISIVTNQEGIKGGAKLWQLDKNLFVQSGSTLS